MKSVAILALIAAVALASCPACDQAACNVATCGKVDPYYCSAGRSAGGCAATPDAWNNTKMCTACCDASKCTSSRFTCTAAPCTTAQCDNSKRCAVNTPFMCTNGTSSYGCSTNSKYWPSQQTCSGCCDVTTCTKKCPKCTADQCQTTLCTKKVPYVCTSGPLKGGCSNSSSYFGNNANCYSCCDASACPAPTPAPYVPTFNCSAPCSKSVCESTTRCDIEHPFMCTAGNSSGGCSTESKYWPTQKTCASCCDVKTCVKKCQPCTSSQCTQNPCTTADPFICVAGPLAGGCSNVSSYFPDQASCYACCDASGCPASGH